MKKLLILISLVFSISVSAGTLFITAKKFGQPIIRFEHIHVVDYGYNSAGAFTVILGNGREILYGKRSHWEMFKYTYLPDNEYLIKH